MWKQINKMWLNFGLPVLLFAIIVRCSELELSREAAFQGRCGHGSPCDQLCYELHDGMYECDCTEGYELNKNGYSCQVINSTYQSSDTSSGNDEDILYQSDALFSAKLDNSQSHNTNKQNINSNTKRNNNTENTNINQNNNDNNLNDNDSLSFNKLNVTGGITNSPSSKNVYKINSKNKVSRRNNNKNFIVKSSASKSSKQINSNVNGGMAITNSLPTANQNAVHIDEYKQHQQQQQQREMFYDKNSDWNDNDDMYNDRQMENANDDYVYSVDDDSGDDTMDYNGNKNVASESIVIKIDSNDKITATSSLKNDNKFYEDTVTERIIVDTSIRPTSIQRKQSSSTGAPTTPPSPITTQPIPNYNYNNEYYYAKDDMSIYDDVNNNRLNLHSSSGHINAFEERNIYMTNNVLSDAKSKTNDSSKSYIHIEVYKGNLDALPTKKAKLSAQLNKNDTQSTTNGSGRAAKEQLPSHSTTKVSTTKHESCVVDCGTDGMCYNDGKTMRCLCPFGKSGNKCGNVAESVSVPRFTKHSWIAFSALRGAYKHVQLHIEFKPETDSGIILLTGERDDLTGDFLTVLMNQGYIEFWFDCGSGIGKVRSDTKVTLNDWNTIIVYRYRLDAWIQLNNGKRIQGRSKGLFSRITFREPVFLGGIGNITGLTKRLPVSDGITGCIRKFIANEHEYSFALAPSGDITQGFDIQECIVDHCMQTKCRHGGKCLSSDQGAICLCPLGFGGDLCEMRLDLQVPLFNGSSYLRFAPLRDTALIWLELKIIVKPQSANGLILYSGHHEYGDYISLSLNNGCVEFAFELGSGPAVVRSELPLSMEQWHTIHVSRTARLAVLKIDQYAEVMTVSPNGFWHLSLPYSLYLGGANNVAFLPLNLKELGSFVGCIQNLEVNGRPLSIISEAIGGTNVDNCPHFCTNATKPCGPLSQCIPNMDSYECQCNPTNLQCNKAEELSIQQAMPTQLSATKASIPATDWQTSTILPNTFGTDQLSSTGTPLLANEKDDTAPVFNLNNKNANTEDTNSDYDDDDYYYDDYNTEDELDSSSRDTNTGIDTISYRMPATTFRTTAATTTTTTTTTPPTSTAAIQTLTSKISSSTTNDPFVTRLFGRYMTVDTEKLLRSEAALTKSKLSTAKTKMNAKASKKHYIPQPLLEPQSPSLLDEIEVDISLPNTNRNDHVTTLKTNTNDKRNDNAFSAKDDSITTSTSKIINSNNNHDSDGNGNGNSDDDDEMSGEFDMMSYYSNEDVLTTKELIDDMAKIMAHGAEIRRNQMNHKAKFVRKIRGACFTGADSYFHYNDAETMKQIISYQIDLNLRFKTHSHNGLILWTGRHTAQSADDYLLLGIENGYLHFRYNLGSGEVNIVYNTTKVSDGLWHRIRILRNLQDGSIEVDGGKAVSKRSPGKLRQLNTDSGLYVGGMPDIMYYTSHRYYSGIIGCISEIVLGGELKLSLDSETLGTAHNVEPGLQ